MDYHKNYYGETLTICAFLLEKIMQMLFKFLSVQNSQFWASDCGYADIKTSLT